MYNKYRIWKTRTQRKNMKGGGAREREKIKGKKNQRVLYIMRGEDCNRKSYHSNGLVCSNIYLNHLKWNETLMKTVKPNVVA